MIEIEITRIPKLDLPLPMRFTEAIKKVESELPVDGVETVEWMRKCGAINYIMSPWYNDYSNAGGLIQAQSNDGWYPGVFTQSYQVFKRQTGDAIAKQGYVRVDNRYGEEVARCPPFQRAFFDRLKGMVIVTDCYRVQHNTLLAEFIKYVKLPFKGTLRLPSIDVARVGYLSLPAIFLARYLPVPFPKCIFYIEYEASHPGELVVEVYKADGTLIGKGSAESDAGSNKAIVTVDAQVQGDTKIVVAYDGAEGGATLYRVYSAVPPTLP